MNDNIAAQSTGTNSQAPAPDYNENLEAQFDNAAESLFSEMNPELFQQQEEQVPEVEEVEEQSTSDDEEIESTEQEEVSEDDDESVQSDEKVDGDEEVELPLVDEEELSNYYFPTKDGPKTWNQIQRELGQVRAASRAQQEVNIQLEQFKSQRAQLDNEYETLRQHQAAAGTMQQLGSQQAKIQQLQVELQEAREDKDFIRREDLRDQIELETQKFYSMKQEVDKSMEQLHQKNQVEQTEIMKNKGFGELLADDQRREALAKYVMTEASQQAMQMVDIDASIAIAFEKARLYDKSKGTAKKGKLRASNKTLRAGSGKIANQKQKQDQALRQKAQEGNLSNDEADMYFEDLAKQMLGT